MKRGKNGKDHVGAMKARPRKFLTPEQKAENRRKFLASLDAKTRTFAAGEFAKLGLFQ